jgi:hypothetical protein
VDRIAVAFFKASTQVVLGNGRRLRFWTDRWLEGRFIAQLALDLTAVVPKQRQKIRLVESNLIQGAWMQNIHGARTLLVLMQYLEIW